MGTVIVILILLIIVYFAARQSIGHLIGRGGCCGGGNCHPKKIEKKHLTGANIKEINLEVEGMNCRNCQSKIENSLNKCKGIVAKANYHTGKVNIKYSDDISDEVLKNIISSDGYRLIKIER